MSLFSISRNARTYSFIYSYYLCVEHMKEVILPESFVLGQMTTKMWLPLAKQGRKTFLMLKNIEEAMQAVSKNCGCN